MIYLILKAAVEHVFCVANLEQQKMLNYHQSDILYGTCRHSQIALGKAGGYHA